MNLDFITAGLGQVKVVAEVIEETVANGRELLAETNKLGSEIRLWWRSPLQEFAQQIEHFDSIAESLRLECEPEVTMLLASAASRMTKPQSNQGESARRVR